jgi:type I restriction enzyme R subunit
MDGLAAVDWRKKQRVRAQVRKEIEIELDKSLPQTYNQEDYNIKCNVVFQHIYYNYYGDGQSMYSMFGH